MVFQRYGRCRLVGGDRYGTATTATDRFLCWLGIRDIRVVSKTFGFVTDGVEKDENHLKWVSFELPLIPRL